MTAIHTWFDGRAEARGAFLYRAGWAEADVAPVGEDSAFRRYFRLRLGARSAVLMESAPPSSGLVTPGHGLEDFIRIGAAIRQAGLHAPQIYTSDVANGYLLLEDLGDLSFRKALAAEDATPLYGLATDVLVQLKNLNTNGLPSYYDSHVHTGRRRVVDWYMPAVRRQKNADGLAESYLAVWDAIEATLPACPEGFLHIDYHVENLMKLPGEGLQSCGILDFQGAMRGPVPYDLVNLLEDARADVAPDIRVAMQDRFCAGLPTGAREAFPAWYRVLATQFHCRVIGQFIRLAVRDGKTRYLAHLPRLRRYVADGLQEPVLTPLKDWFEAQGMDFSGPVSLPDPAAIAPFIRDDAF